MSARRRIVLLMLLFGAVCAVPVIAQAAKAERTLLIGFSLQFTGPTTTAGTFIASGAVSDAGNSTVDDLSVVPLETGDRGRLTGVQTFTGAQGTIVTRFTGVARAISQPHQAGLGRVRIVSATGAYEGLRGRGEFTIVVHTTGNSLIGTEEIRVRQR